MTKLNFPLLKWKVAWLTFLLTNVFSWYYLTVNLIAIVSEKFNLNQLTFLSFHSFGVIVGGVVGLPFLRRRYILLCLWTFLGAIASFSWIFISNSLHFQLACFTCGFSFGLGMPSCLGYFAGNIAIDKRGQVSGMILLFSFLFAFPLLSLAKMSEFLVMYLFLGFWRLLGFIPLSILKDELKFKFKENGDYERALVQKKIWLYLIPWLVFNIVDNLEILLLKEFVKTAFQDHVLLQFASFPFLVIFAFLGGVLCDLIGRKPLTILGFTTMGLAYAIISMAPLSLPAWFLFYCCNGFSWGLFYTIFILVIWGDLAPKGATEKYYFVGNAPFFLATIFRGYFASYIKLLNETNAFSLAALLLFLAVVPLLYAPETLPEKVIRERELKSYIEKAKKIREKFV